MATEDNGDGRMMTMEMDDDGSNDNIQFISPPPPRWWWWWRMTMAATTAVNSFSPPPYNDGEGQWRWGATTMGGDRQMTMIATDDNGLNNDGQFYSPPPYDNYDGDG
jgi:hypothetical protein